MTTSSLSPAHPGVTPPRATYRLQLNRDFTFANAAKQAEYLGRLGISHVYLSPILKARAGSTHGYDTVDHTILNPEIGTLDGFRDMARAFRRAGLGIVLDIVPNHMGVGGHENALWLDVLEWGEASRYAEWFDINWTPAEASLQHKLLVPFLGTSYDEALRSGDLKLKFDAHEGSLAIWSGGTHKLPLSLPSYAQIIGGIAGLDAIAHSFRAASSDTGENLKRELARLCAVETAARANLERRLAHLGSAAGVDDLDRLIGRQHWRAARHSVAADDINYRRFFIVSDLAGLRVERDDVFEHVHRLTFQLVEEGWVDGLRVDHIDGLLDPAAYCRKLRERCPRPVYLVVEKILAAGELLPAGWGIDGTTGYEFASETLQLLTDPAGEAALTAGYVDFTGDRATAAEAERVAKLGIMDFEMTAEVAALAERLHRLSSTTRETRDLTRTALSLALRQFVASLPVYRTYVDADGASPGDREIIAGAIAVARREAPTIDPAVFDFLEAVAGGELGGEEGGAIAQRIQQLSGPVMAKGLEDTALYRCNRLLSASDVGQRPDRFSLTPEAYHRTTRERASAYPASMLGTSSHDSKRGEDTRARIAVLSGMPERWRDEVEEWTRLLEEAVAPEIDRNDLYALYQLLLGAWPTAFAPGVALDRGELDRLGERLVGAMTKGLREARLRSTWVRPDEGYEAAVGRVVRTMVSDDRFLTRFRAFEAAVGPLGAMNGLALTTLKLTVPGVPDIYQGAEVWEQSMVDPDNRRPVDFAARAAAIGGQELLEELVETWRDGRVKQELVRELLTLRTERAELFAKGSYVPLEAGDAVLAFERTLGVDRLRVAVRLFAWRGPTETVLAPSASEWRVVVGETAGKASGELVADFSRLPMLVAMRQ